MSDGSRYRKAYCPKRHMLFTVPPDSLLAVFEQFLDDREKRTELYQCFEEAAVGCAVIEGGRKGAAIVNPPNDELAENKAECKRLYQMWTGDGMSISNAERRLAVQFERKPKTIRRWLGKK